MSGLCLCERVGRLRFLIRLLPPLDSLQFEHGAVWHQSDVHRARIFQNQCGRPKAVEEKPGRAVEQDSPGREGRVQPRLYRYV